MAINIKKALKDIWYGKPHTAEEGGRPAQSPVRLACVMHDASVNSEPGSNSPLELITFKLQAA